MFNNFGVMNLRKTKKSDFWEKSDFFEKSGFNEFFRLKIPKFCKF